jgi:hypothetical protein
VTTLQNSRLGSETISSDKYSRMIVRAENFEGSQSADAIVDGGIFSTVVASGHANNYTAEKQVPPMTARDISIKTTVGQTGGATHDALYRISATALGIVIASGDSLEFDIFLDGTSSHFKAGVYIRFSDGTITEGVNALVDQNALNVNNGDKTAFAKEAWYHVKAAFLAGHVGKTIDHVGIFDSNGTTSASSTVTYLRQIVVTNGNVPTSYIYKSGHVIAQALFRDTTGSVAGAIARANYLSDSHTDDLTTFGVTIFASGTVTPLGSWLNAGLFMGQKSSFGTNRDPNTRVSAAAYGMMSEIGSLSGSGALSLTGSKTGADGLVADLAFVNEAIATTDSRLAILRANRSGADNSGQLVVFTKNAGAFVQAAQFSPNGFLGLGNVAPAAQLDVNGQVALRRNTVTIGNGANQDIAIGAFSYIRLTGPTGAFSLGGIAAPASPNGHFLIVQNTTLQTMTINNQDAGSAAANRIYTLTGGNVSLRAAGSSVALFIYDPDAASWIMLPTN